MATLSTGKVRHLEAQELGVSLPTPKSSGVPTPASGTQPQDPEEAPEIDLEDPILQTVEDLLQSYGGVLFTGPPGTSKSYYAEQIGKALAGPARVRTVQFHPSYQYEDFMEGYVPGRDGYVLAPKHFVLICEDAAAHPENRYFLVIDELSRADPGRVFGEALTYIERSKRGKKFRLASGRELQVPPNLEILATMNPLDRGVDEVDAALNRRFAKYAMEPNDSLLNQFLLDAAMEEGLRTRVGNFFRYVNSASASANNPHAALGHTYFSGVRDVAALTRLWEHQLRFHFEQAYRLDENGLAEVRSAWDKVVTPPSVPASGTSVDGA